MQRAWMRRMDLIMLAVVLGTATLATAQVNKRKMKVEHYTRKAYAAYQNKNWKESIKYFSYLLRHVPYDGGVYYNLACSHALNGDKQEALDALADAVAYGWDDAEWMQVDADLAGLRSDPQFARLLSDAVECREERFVLYRPDDLSEATAAPLIVALHTIAGHPRQFMAELRGVADALGAVIVAPRGVRSVGSRQQMRYGWHESPTSPRVNVTEVAGVVDAAIAAARTTGSIDPQRIVLVGYSQGGAAALLTAAAQPERFPRVVALAAGYDQVKQLEFPKAEGDLRLRVGLAVGERDGHKATVEATRTELEEAGHLVRYEEIPIIGEELPDDIETRVLDAARFVLAN